MKLSDISDKNTARIKFISFFGAAVFLCLVIFSSFWAPSNMKAAPEIRKAAGRDNTTGIEQLLHVSELLHFKWLQLEEQYDRNALSLAEPSKSPSNNQASSKKLMEAEVSYAKVLDSVSAKFSPSSFAVEVDSIVNSFRTMLQKKQVVNTRLAEMAFKNLPGSRAVNLVDTNTRQEKLSLLEKDVQGKSVLIAQLQAQLNAAPARNSTAAGDQQELRKMQQDLQSKTAMISQLQLQLKAVPSKASREETVSPASLKKMKKEIEFLKWALRSEVSSNQAHTENVNRLKQANANMANQLKKN